MSETMGPDGTDAGDLNALARLSAAVLAGLIPVINAAGRVVGGDGRYRFDRHALRLSIHGESENAGDEFSRGRLAGALVPLVQMGSLVGSAVVSVGLLGLATVIGEAAARPLAVLSLLGPLTSYGAIIGCWWLSDAISIVDHTTEPRPEVLDELEQRFVDGDLTEQELEQQVEQVIDR